MPEEPHSGAWYLKALKQTPGSHEAAATARAPQANPQESSTQPRAGERRRSTRYKCSGSAAIRKDGTDQQTWATFTDISIHGCYIEAQATHPVGTILHMKLEVNGSRVETKGNVRVTYPSLGMGVAFVEADAETRERLKHLVGSLLRSNGTMGLGITSLGISSSAPDLDSAATAKAVADPAAAIRALIEFFENRQLLMRDDFLRILRTSQASQSKP